MKKLILITSIIIFTFSAFAQDVIVKNDGTKIFAQIVSNANSEILYQLKGNKAILKIQKSEVSKLKYKMQGMTSYSKGSQPYRYVVVDAKNKSIIKKEYTSGYNYKENKAAQNAMILNGCFYTSLWLAFLFWL